jgi:hypothetical protein
MASNNNRQNNTNKPKIYISPFNKNFRKQTNSYHKANNISNNNSYVKINNTHENYKNNLNKFNFNQNPISKNINNKPTQILNPLLTPTLNNIESIEIYPMDYSNKSYIYKPEESNNNNIFQNILKKFLFNEEEKINNNIQSIPAFSIDINKDYHLIDKPIKSLDDLIELGKLYNPETADNYAINLKQLNNLIDSLTELKNIIGMKTVKDSIVDQIIYFLQSFEENNNMLHTIIEGHPGVGKTMLGYILGKIYYNMGILKGSQNAINSLTGKKDNFIFKIVKRKDLIGEYLGHTAIKTQKIIDECKGGVLFIDEAYSLGNLDKKDTYSKECIDTINQNLSENKNNFMCIIAGYPEQLEKCFFSYNEGLKRRFTFKYTIEKYNAKELCEIFKKMVFDSKWSLDVDDAILEKFINKNIKEFENFGGDIETLLFRTKITHSRRVFCKHPRDRKKINIEDIYNAFELFKLNKKKITDEISDELLKKIYT